MYTRLQQYIRGAFLFSAHCSFGNTISLRSVWCRRAMIPREIFTNFAAFQGIVSVNDLGFLSGSMNFCKLLSVSCEVLVLHEYAWIHWVVRSCTTTAYRWLCRDSQLSLRTMWSAVIKSPKFAARGTASPLRLLYGAFVILVRLHISKFRSLGKWVYTLCSPKSSRLFVDRL